MRAGWILLEIRHKQYEVNVDEVGCDAHIAPRPIWAFGWPTINKKTTHCNAMGGGGAERLIFY